MLLHNPTWHMERGCLAHIEPSTSHMSLQTQSVPLPHSWGSQNRDGALCCVVFLAYLRIQISLLLAAIKCKS